MKPKWKPPTKFIDAGEATAEFDGKDLFLVCGGMRVAKRQGGKWVALEGGPPVEDMSDCDEGFGSSQP